MGTGECDPFNRERVLRARGKAVPRFHRQLLLTLPDSGAQQLKAQRTSFVLPPNRCNLPSNDNGTRANKTAQSKREVTADLLYKAAVVSGFVSAADDGFRRRLITTDTRVWRCVLQDVECGFNAACL